MTDRVHQNVQQPELVIYLLTRRAWQQTLCRFISGDNHPVDLKTSTWVTFKRTAHLLVILEPSFVVLSPASPDCYFEESMCDWVADEGWVLDTLLAGLEKRGKICYRFI